MSPHNRMSHKFHVGQLVEFRPKRGWPILSARGAYETLKQLPERRYTCREHTSASAPAGAWFELKGRHAVAVMPCKSRVLSLPEGSDAAIRACRCTACRHETRLTGRQHPHQHGLAPAKAPVVRRSCSSAALLIPYCSSPSRIRFRFHTTKTQSGRRLGCPQIHDQLERHRLLDGQIARLGAFKRVSSHVPTGVGQGRSRI